MTFWLDKITFGNGYGMGLPFWDQQLFWLVDESEGKRASRNGRLYRWIGGLGAQLSSFEWRHPKPGTRRKLAGRKFVAFNSTRRWLRVDVSWALVDLPRNLDDANTTIRALKSELSR